MTETDLVNLIELKIVPIVLLICIIVVICYNIVNKFKD